VRRRVLRGSRDDAAIRLGFFAKVAPRVVPTIVGLYLFGRCPQLVFPEWGLGCAAFAGTSIDAPITRRADAEGPLAALLESGLSFVRSHSGAEDDSSSEYSRRWCGAVTNALDRDLRKGVGCSWRFTDRPKCGARAARRKDRRFGGFLSGAGLPRNRCCGPARVLA
jgi:hypothetical protein